MSSNKPEEIKPKVIIEPPLKPESKPAKPGETPGAILKKKRLAKGISIEIVHETTKIPLDALRAIEEGYTVKVLSPYYLKGFLKIYARYLNVDISDALKDMDKKETVKKIVVKEVKKEFDPGDWVKKNIDAEKVKQILLLLGVILAIFIFFKIVFAVGAWIKRYNANKPKVQAVKKTSSQPAKKSGKPEQKKVQKITEAKKEETKPTEKKKEPVAEKKIEEVKKEIAVKEVTPVEAVVPATVGQKEVEAAKNTEPLSAKEVSGNIVLTVRAKKAAWLTVKRDGEMVFRSTLRTGAVETWIADKTIELSGQISELEFELNGKMVGALGTKVRQAKTVLITKDGLSVVK